MKRTEKNVSEQSVTIGAKNVAISHRHKLKNLDIFDFQTHWSILGNFSTEYCSISVQFSKTSKSYKI